MKFIMVHAFWVRLRNDRSRPVSCPNCLQAGCRDCSALRGRVDVAGAAHGLDDLRLGRVALDLAADAGEAVGVAAVEGPLVAIVSAESGGAHVLYQITNAHVITILILEKIKYILRIETVHKKL